MKILITGGNGFLGYNLIKKLLNEGHSLYVFSKNTNNLKNLMNKIKFQSSYANDLIKYKQDIIDFSPNIILYCGWSGGNNYKDTNSLNQFYDNLEPGINFLQILKDIPSKPKFVGFGTILEYGVHSFPVNETYNEKPLDLYGVSKNAFKNYSKIFCEFYDIEWTWLRLGYNYGPYDVDTRLIPSLIKQFLNNQNIELDECNKTIDYLYVDDFVNFTYNLINKKATGVYNISSGTSYILKDIIQIIHSLCNSKSNIIFNPNKNRKNTSSYVCLDNSKLKTTTNLKPKFNLTSGIKETIKYYKKLNEL